MEVVLGKDVYGKIKLANGGLIRAYTGSTSKTKTKLSRKIQFGILSGPHDLLVLTLNTLK